MSQSIPHRLLGLPSFRNIRAAVAGTGFIGVVHVEALRRLGAGRKNAGGRWVDVTR